MITQQALEYYISLVISYPNKYKPENRAKKNIPELFEYIDGLVAPLGHRGKPMPYKQKLWHIIHNDLEFSIGLCDCGNRCRFTGGRYLSYCSSKCMGSSEEYKKLQHKIKTSEAYKNKYTKTCIERYGVPFAMQAKEVKIKATRTMKEKYGVEHALQNPESLAKAHQTIKKRYSVEHALQNIYVKEKSKKVCREKYGTDCSLQNIEVRAKALKVMKEKYGAEYALQCHTIKAKAKQTCMDKYGVGHVSQIQEVKEKKIRTCMQHHGVRYPAQSPEVLEKLYEAKRKNNSFHTSKIEEDIVQWMDSMHIKYTRQYRSEMYPFNCDFYLVDYQLYIEINASWTHGKKPYIDGDVECMEQLKQWQEKAESSKYYMNAIEVWTIRDVMKRETAKTNMLNYLEIFSNDVKTCCDIIKNRISM